MGLAATRVPWLRRRYVGERSPWAREQLQRRLPSAVLLARVIPGLRLVTYTACGFVRVPLAPFYGLGGAGGDAVDAGPVRPERRHRPRRWREHLGLPPPVAVACPSSCWPLAVPLWRMARQRFRGSSA